MQLFKNLDFVSGKEYIDINSKDLGIMPLIKSVLESNKGHLSEYYQSGSIVAESKFKNVGEMCKDFFLHKEGRLIWEKISDGGNSSMFLWEDSIGDIAVNNDYVSIRIVSKRESLVKEIKNYFNDKWAEPETKGHVYCIMQQGSELVLNSIGNAGITYIPENYMPNVVKDYNFAISDLQAEHPSGRVIIMTGIPGSGKSFLIRSLLLQIPDAMFVLVPPDMVANLAGPSLLPLLLDYKGAKAGPIILILEDADQCLVVRDKDNMSSIQALLNLGDGIIGSMLDLRIVATTNAEKLHMEEAMMREGRLSQLIEVGHLDLETATKILLRLCPNVQNPESLFNDKITLAKVYSIARKNGWLPPRRKIEHKDKVENLFE